ncbi:MAG: outer membrane beta-barrel protein [Bacteroidota bacterium]
MKRLKFLILVLVFVFTINSINANNIIINKGNETPVFSKGKNKKNEQWVTVGARGTVNSTWLLNSNLLKDRGVAYQVSWGYDGGIMVGYHFTTLAALNIEATYASYSQKLESAVDSNKWNNKSTLTYLEFPILLHFDFENFNHLEFGVKLAMLQTAKGSYTGEKTPLGNYSNQNIIPNYSKNNTAIVLGWGSGIWGEGGFLLSAGIRLSYGLADIISAVGGKGQEYLTYSSPQQKQSYKKTNTATIGIHLNLDFDLGQVFSSNCGRSSKFFLFEH